MGRLVNDDLRRWAAERMPALPDGYVIKQFKNGRWYGKSPHADFDVKSTDRDEVVHWLRLNAITHETRADVEIEVAS